MSSQYLPTHIRYVHKAGSANSAATSSPFSCPRVSCTPAPDPYTVHLDTEQILCPVPDCPAFMSDSFAMRRHLCIRHPADVFQFIGNSHFQQCPHCHLYLTRVNSDHIHSAFCVRQTKRWNRLQVHNTPVDSTPFHIGDQAIEFVSQFRYLGRILSDDDSDDPAAFARLHQARVVWGRFANLLHRDGASVDTMGRFYVTIVQQTLLFGSSTWVLSSRTLQQLERFHARSAWGIAHRHIHRRSDGTWDTSLLVRFWLLVDYNLFWCTFNVTVIIYLHIMRRHIVLCIADV